MRRLLAPAFLTTVSLAAGCKKEAIPDGNTHNPPYIPDATDAGRTVRHTENPPGPIGDGANPDAAGTTTTAEVDAGPKTAAKPTKKRKRTAAANMTALAGGGTLNWETAKTVNPSDDKGRLIQAMSDDTCAVQVPYNGPPLPKNGPTGFSPRSYEAVDCPKEMDDAAYDDCTYRIMFDAGSCYCMSDGGNPPPPPRKQKCPANAKDAAAPKKRP